ncbi:lysoplasmalogenase [Maritimibacter sp. UBA3975]|uniref:lysoplasmalogenase n=1 Tax=Maritimibacter sp. UBA3975 TaxID=1946833 RepID=UPI000C0A152D|nr:lysoplasmalogenase [Maritimibacter sp. UBA3975]MAM63240.1 lysoplasmalogenase [Maritimibacter sp.]|tara:strand:+ start:5611 stop:6237 length:627 start_codon:yes stop_codon:yes gene_type:complete
MIYLRIASALIALVYWVAAPVGGDGSLINSLVKTAAVALLALSVVPTGRWLLVGALALGAVGDFCLSRPSELWFMGGMGAFALAHVLYIVLFLKLPTQIRALPMGLLVVYGLGMAFVLWDGAGDLRIPVMAYILVIIGMGLAALSRARGPQFAVLLAGAALFIVSDSLLATNLFLYDGGFAGAILVWPTYWLAQFALMWGFERAGRAD